MTDSKEENNNKVATNKVFYGDSSEVNAVGYKDYNDFIENKGSNQQLKGFDDQYLDFVDYIVKITHHIWEEKGIGIIYDTYHNNILMHAGSQNIRGIKEVISGTLQTLHSFPDRKLIAQNVIWSKCAEGGYFSSHRIMSTATNLGNSKFGPATNRKVSFRTAVDTIAHDNRIYEEWLVRDNLLLVKQLGFDPRVIAKSMARDDLDNEISFQKDYGLEETVKGQLYPERYKARDSSIGEFIIEVLNNIYKCRLFNKVKEYYNDNAIVHYICDKDLTGYNEIQGMLVSLFASFPNAGFSIDRITCNQRSDETKWDVAVRWRLRGLHEGIGYFGRPSGKKVNILGISHFYIVDRKIKEEWITYDGLDVLQQIYTANGNYEMDDNCESIEDANQVEDY